MSGKNRNKKSDKPKIKYDDLNDESLIDDVRKHSMEIAIH
jgi:hypothetical protein